MVSNDCKEKCRDFGMLVENIICIIAVNGAHKQYVKSEPKTVVGIILSILALISCFGMN